MRYLSRINLHHIFIKDYDSVDRELDLTKKINFNSKFCKACLQMSLSQNLTLISKEILFIELFISQRSSVVFLKQIPTFIATIRKSNLFLVSEFLLSFYLIPNVLFSVNYSIQVQNLGFLFPFGKVFEYALLSTTLPKQLNFYYK